MAETNTIDGLSLDVLSDREIVMTRVIGAPRQRVFEAWTDPKHLPQWFGRRGWTMPVCQIDFRPGGTWRFVSRGPKDQEMGMSGVYQEITPYERLVYTQSFDDYPGETLNTLILTEEEAGKTTVTCKVVYPSKEARDAVLRTRMHEGAAESMSRLDEHVQAMA